jgi:hypothetical protein
MMNTHKKKGKKKQKKSSITACLKVHTSHFFPPIIDA